MLHSQRNYGNCWRDHRAHQVFSKRERMLEAINENMEVLSDGDNDVFEKVTALSKLSVTP